VERAVALAGGGPLSASHLAFENFPSRAPSSNPVVVELPIDRHANEKYRIEHALQRTSGNQTEAAKLLGISRRALLNKLDRFGFARPRKKIAAR
jgi:DNA-binding NtrC family response regulator